MKRLALAALLLFIPARSDAFYLYFNFFPDPTDPRGNEASGWWRFDGIPHTYGDFNWDRPENFSDEYIHLKWDKQDWSDVPMTLTSGLVYYQDQELPSLAGDWTLDSAPTIWDPIVLSGYSIRFFSKTGTLWYSDPHGNWIGSGTWYASNVVPPVDEPGSAALPIIGGIIACMSCLRPRRSTGYHPLWVLVPCS